MLKTLMNRGQENGAAGFLNQCVACCAWIVGFADGNLTLARASENPHVPRKQKINLGKVLASLNIPCPKCGYSIAPDKLRRIDSQQIECPECGEHFIPEKR